MMEYNLSSGNPETFKSVIMGYFYRISENTGLQKKIVLLADLIYANIYPYISEEDIEWWERDAGGSDWASTMMKLRIITLILYKIGVFPQRDELQNKKFEMFVTGKETTIKKGMQEFIVEGMEISQFVFRHMQLAGRIAQEEGNLSMHLDCLWFVISPYITEEDYIDWDMNRKAHTRGKYGDYRWNIEKAKIISTVLERADFLWESSMVDEPQEFIDGDGNIGIRAKQ